MAASISGWSLKLERKNLRFLWVGQLISQAGDAITHLAVLWLVLELTGSNSLTGLVAFAATLPMLLFSPGAGVLVDRIPRKQILILSDGARFFLVLSIPVLYQLEKLNMGILLILVFVIYSFAAFFNPARDALIPQLTVPERLVKVNALMQSTGYLSYFLGLFGAGILLSKLAITSLFYLDSTTFLISLITLSLISVPRTVDKSNTTSSFWQELQQGLIYISKKDPRLLKLLIITAINNFFIMGPAVVGMPIFVKEVWGGGGSDFAFVESTYGLSMLLGTFLVFRYAHYRRKGGWLMLALIYDGLSYIPLYLVGRIPVSPLHLTVFFIFIHAIGIPFIQVSRVSLIQSLVPNNLQGRVFAMFNLAVTGMTSLSVLVTGIVLEILDPTLLFVVIGLGAAACGIYGLAVPELRTAD